MDHFGKRKREVQRKLNKRLVNKFKDGIILTFAGPTPQKAIQIYQESRIANSFILFEKDEKTFNSIKDIKSKNISIFKENLFDSLWLKLCTNINGFDLDFCQSFNHEIFISTTLFLNYLFQNNTSDRVWVRITSSIAINCGRKQLEKRYGNLIQYLTLGNFELEDFIVTAYRDSRPMEVSQFIFKRKENTMKKKTTTCNTANFKQLSDSQKNMVRDLCMIGHDSHEIADLCGVRTSTIAAVKANISRR